VADTGIGIAENEKENIFSAFYQIYRSRDAVSEGAGLGLAICETLVKNLGSELQVDSSPGKGSIFRFVISLCALEKTSKTRQEKQQSILRPEGLRLLLVEDNAINVEVARAMLERAGFTIDVAENGQVALEKLENVFYNLVLMDLDMPVLDGVSATTKLRAGEAGDTNRQVPVLALTAHALGQFRDQAEAAGMQGFITKPYIAENLIQEILQTARPEITP
jgi:CheY-like chemotaxis protein